MFMWIVIFNEYMYIICGNAMNKRWANIYVYTLNYMTWVGKNVNATVKFEISIKFWADFIKFFI